MNVRGRLVTARLAVAGIAVLTLAACGGAPPERPHPSAESNRDPRTGIVIVENFFGRNSHLWKRCDGSRLVYVSAGDGIVVLPDAIECEG